jgi:hypothetical protein
MYEQAYLFDQSSWKFNGKTQNFNEGSKLSILPYHPSLSADRFLLKLHGCVNHPDDIVLTRKDYIRYRERGAVLAGVMQSALLTKHLLYIGFSLTDDNFHTIFDAVRRSVGGADPDKSDKRDAVGCSVGGTGPDKSKKLDLSTRNTAVLLRASHLERELWEDDVTIISVANQKTSAALSRRVYIYTI